MFMLYIDASSVTNCKSGDDAASAGIEFSIKDYYAIQVMSYVNTSSSCVCVLLFLR